MNAAKPAKAPALTTEEVRSFLAEVFPQMGSRSVLEETGPMTSRVRIVVGERQLRPGGTVSGPTLFAAADFAFYAAVLAMIGREALTVTTNLSIDFMRAPKSRDVIAEARILKLGRRLAFGDVLLFSDGEPDPVARASVTYAIPDATP